MPREKELTMFTLRFRTAVLTGPVLKAPIVIAVYNVVDGSACLTDMVYLFFRAIENVLAMTNISKRRAMLINLELRHRLSSFRLAGLYSI